MTDQPTKPEKQLELSKPDGVEQAQVEKKVAAARPAARGDLAEQKTQPNDNQQLKLELGDKDYPDRVKAESRVANALAPDPAQMTLDARRFKPETQRALAQAGLTPDAVASDNSGANAEAYTRTVLKSEGLPDGGDGVEALKDVVPGQFGSSHGIDLVGITESGDPVPIEVKKRNDPGKDGHLDPGQLKDGSYQMDDQWTKERWRRLVESPEGAEQLRQAGVQPKYLRPENLKDDSPLWQTILDNKVAVVVSNKDDSSGRKMFDQAVFERRVGRVMRIYTG
jgi:hypothetical protein